MDYISRLNAQKKILDVLFDDRRTYSRRYRKGGWTGKEILIHLKDAETVFYDRIRRVISEENPILWYFEEDKWARRLDYKRQDIALAKKLFMATREAIAEIATAHLRAYGTKQGIHSRYGLMDMRELMRRMIVHTDKHIGHLRAITSKIR